MTYYVDVAKYQPEALDSYKQAGASGAIIQLTVGNSIVAPKAQAQVNSARQLGMTVQGYHYACFGHSISQAKAEANFTSKRAKQLGIGVLYCDWESEDNDTLGSAVQNTDAIIAFMQTVKDNGITPGLYSSASFMRGLNNKIGVYPIIQRFGSCIWVASYPTMNAVSDADMNWFPSMDGVCAWQFTSNWKGLNVDCSKILINLKPIVKPKPNPAPTKHKTITITGDNLTIKESD